ncbi:hypothetical protein ACTOB_001392 [Actinoplanes oblitus]|uniref:Tail terminator n=1 Tax=Actinoplanes oblitus TaxID=3040509 RepID=A0ABY8WJM4_9ACTN|nr:hypothetical protein [Actinoplanes oblitus]WIM97838.1 hypothetical protein ACTOB_001392 [Actinoplanes oblitus]
MQLAQVKAALRDAVAAAEIPGLQCTAYVPAEPHPPAFYPGEVVFAPNNSFGPGPGGYDTVDITCRVLTSNAEDADGQALLDTLLSRSGPYSIRQALLAARGAPGQPALGGLADDLMIVRIDGYREIPGPNEASYYGAQITVRVVGSGS